MKKLMSYVATSVLAVGLLSGCASSNENTSAQTGNDVKEEKAQTLKLAHNLSEDHPVHKALVEFATTVEEKSNASVKVQIFANGVLGGEKEVLEQLKGGAVDMTRVSAGALENFAPEYAVFSLPYLFVSQDHYYKAMDSEAVQKLYEANKDKGFVGLTFYDSGARSFYTKDKAIQTPEDLKGLKIRVMDSPTAIKMVQLLGGNPTPMAYGEIYTALQSGVIDGAESNETALTTGKHGEVAKQFSINQHTMIPDVLVISSKTWDGLSAEQQQIVKEAAKASTESQKVLWNQAIEEAKAEAQSKLGVTFNEVDKAPFIEKVQPMHEEYSNKDPKIKEIIDAFEALK
ncbi:TRAP transporter substrate-binding protein [Ammoniphilus sp. YIM 78166]|uniref:TRAP transporter substrate-binding protein n=1 Tax=Ammoniphilus sp. YIM 78166 TaxID=1644106 RepID=UPI00106F0ECC|nr:TRAP transporter substrate-binding protein [Ammoniphilus sp. YIM 78166]